MEGRQAIPKFAPGTLLNQCRSLHNKETHRGGGVMPVRLYSMIHVVLDTSKVKSLDLSSLVCNRLNLKNLDFYKK